MTRRTMKAVMWTPGPAGATVAVREVDIPTPGSGEVLVRVKAASLNRGELAIRAALRSGAPRPNGIDFVGEVVELGSDVVAVALGDRVMGHWQAGQAQYVAADVRLLVPIPHRLSWVEAAAWLNVFTTAHDAIVTNARLGRGESILVNAASSGIGVAALQIARLVGAAPVIGTSRSPGKLSTLATFGMSVGIAADASDHLDQIKAATNGKGVDVIIDSVGGASLQQSLEALALGGRLVTVGRLAGHESTIDLDLVALKRLHVIGTTFRTRSLEQRAVVVQSAARDLLPALDDGRLQPVVYRTFAMDQIAQAHVLLERNEHIGKMVLEIS